MLYKTIISKNLNTLKIFSLDSKLRRALVLFAFCCQLVSGFTEYLGIAPFLIDLLKPFLSHSLSAWMGNSIALLLALFLEFLIFYLVGFIIHAIRAKYLNLKGDKIDKVFNQIKFWSASALLVILIGISMFLSKRNVRYQIQATVMEAPSIDLSEIDAVEKKKITTIENRYIADKNDLTKSYPENKEAIQNAYTAKRNAIQEQINSIEEKENRTGKSYRTKKNKHHNKIAELQTTETDELHQLLLQNNTNLATLKTQRNTAIASIEKTYATNRNKATLKNQQSEQALSSRNDWISFVLQWIASLSVLGFVIARAWVCMSNATAGVMEKAMPLKENFSSQFWKELILLCRLKIQRKLQNRVRRELTTIPELIEIESSGAVLSLSPTENTDDKQNNRRRLTQDIKEIPLDDKSSSQKVTDKGQILSEKSCLNCGEKFYYKNKKAKYCSTACRREFWERKNGKYLGKQKSFGRTK